MMILFALGFLCVSHAETNSQEKLNALRQYQRERLEISNETNISGGATTAYMRGPTMGYGSLGFMISDSIHTTRTMKVYQAQEPISTAIFLELTGQEGEREDLDALLAKYRKRKAAGRVVAALGLGTTIGGWVGVSQSVTENEVYLYSNVTLGGSILCFGGLLISSFPASKEASLLMTPLNYLSKADVEGRVDAFNDALRTELGLSVEDIWSIESGNSN
jgi:hypothetical protein